MLQVLRKPTTSTSPSATRPKTTRIRTKALSAPCSVDLRGAGPRRLFRRLAGFHPEPPNPIAGPYPPSASATSSATSDGLVAALMPAPRRASLLASAVLSPPETMAPAWPMVFPSGAVKPAM